MPKKKIAAFPLVPVLLGFVLAVGVSGCGMSGPTLDTTNDETLKTSIEEMNATLSNAEQQQLSEAMLVLTMAHAMQNDTAGGGQKSPLAAMQNAVKSLHGMTAKQIIAKAQATREELKAKNAK